MLIVVHDRDVELLDEPTLDLEAFGGLDVLEVDATEGRGYRLDDLDELVDIRPVDFDVEDVDVCGTVYRKKQAFDGGNLVLEQSTCGSGDYREQEGSMLRVGNP